MKHNPRLNEKAARFPGFADIHPLQPVANVHGALAVIDELAKWLKTLTGMAAVAMRQMAGKPGELCGYIANARKSVVERTRKTVRINLGVRRAIKKKKQK